MDLMIMSITSTKYGAEKKTSDARKNDPLGMMNST